MMRRPEQRARANAHRGTCVYPHRPFVRASSSSLSSERRRRHRSTAQHGTRETRRAFAPPLFRRDARRETRDARRETRDERRETRRVETSAPRFGRSNTICVARRPCLQWNCTLSSSVNAVLNSSRCAGVSCATRAVRYAFSAGSPHLTVRRAAWSSRMRRGEKVVFLNGSERSSASACRGGRPSIRHAISTEGGVPGRTHAQRRARAAAAASMIAHGMIHRIGRQMEARRPYIGRAHNQKNKPKTMTRRLTCMSGRPAMRVASLPRSA